MNSENYHATAVIPIHNNAGALPELIDRLRSVSGLRVLFIEDAGSDNSRDILSEKSDERVGSLWLKENLGQHKAVLTGLKTVRTEMAVVLDGDLQDRPEAIPGLLSGLCGADIVFAQRPSHTSLGSALLKGVFRLASRGRLPPRVGTNVALGPRALQMLTRVTNPDPYLIGLLALSGLSIDSFPVSRDPRFGGRSSYTFRARLWLGLRSLRGSGLMPWLPMLVRPRQACIAGKTGWLTNS